MRINMLPRSLFDVILKVIGIFFIRDVLEAVSRSLSVLVYFPQYANRREAFFNLGVTLPPLILYSIFAWLLLFRTSSLTKIMKIEKHFGDKPLGINVNSKIVLTVAVVLMGGWFLVNEIPELFRQAVYYYQEKILYDRMVLPDYSYPATSAAKVVIGLLLVFWHRPVVRMIEGLTKNVKRET
jgi:hypothetical protein